MSHVSSASKCSDICFAMAVIDGKDRLGRSLFFFLLKTGFGPRTAKSQPIWKNFCTQLLLYGIHLWADLDHDRRMGDSRPNQNDCVFVILVTHPKSYIETTHRRDFGGKPSKWRWGRVLSWKLGNFVAWVEPDKKTEFLSRFRVPSTILRIAYRKVLPQTNGTDGKPRLCWCAFC